jgi:hypothetical protein
MRSGGLQRTRMRTRRIRLRYDNGPDAPVHVGRKTLAVHYLQRWPAPDVTHEFTARRWTKSSLHQAQLGGGSGTAGGVTRCPHLRCQRWNGCSCVSSGSQWACCVLGGAWGTACWSPLLQISSVAQFASSVNSQTGTDISFLRDVYHGGPARPAKAGSGLAPGNGCSSASCVTRVQCVQFRTTCWAAGRAFVCHLRAFVWALCSTASCRLKASWPQWRGDECASQICGHAGSNLQ